MAITPFAASVRALVAALLLFGTMSCPAREAYVGFSWKALSQDTRDDPPIDPPLPDTYRGQPIDPAQTTAVDVRRYVNHETMLRYCVKLPEIPGPVVIITNTLSMAMAHEVAKFGFANVLEAYQRGPIPVQATSDNGQVDYSPYLEDCETQILLEALIYAATDDDLPKLLDHADNDPNLLSVILARNDWRSDPRVHDFVLTRLDAANPQRRDSMNRDLFEYALDSSDPDIQNKVAGILQGWINEANSASPSSSNDAAKSEGQDDDTPEQLRDRFVDQTMSYCLHTENAPSLALVPAWASLRKSEAADFFLDGLAGHPEPFAKEPVREGLQTIIADAKGSDDSTLTLTFFKAALGDRASFKALMNAYAQANQPISTPPAPAQNGHAPTPLDMLSNQPPAPPSCNHPTTDQRMIQFNGLNLLRMVNYKGAGNKLAAVMQHLNDATYAKGQWTVTDATSPGVPSGAVPATNAVSTAPAPSVSTSTPPQ